MSKVIDIPLPSLENDGSKLPDDDIPMWLSETGYTQSIEGAISDIIAKGKTVRVAITERRCKKANFCKNAEPNETVTADRGTQSAPVAPAGVVRRGGAPSARPEKGEEV